MHIGARGAPFTLLFLSGCAMDGRLGPAPVESLLQVINATNLPLSVRIDGAVRVPSLAPGSLSVPLPVSGASPSVQVSGAALARGGADTRPTTLEVAVRATAGGRDVVAVMRRPNGVFDVLVFPDTGRPVDVSRGRVRVVHLAAGVGDVEVRHRPPSVAEPLTHAGSLSYRSAVTVEGAPGAWELAIGPSGASREPLPVFVAGAELRIVLLLDDGSGGTLLQVLEPVPLSAAGAAGSERRKY